MEYLDSKYKQVWSKVCALLEQIGTEVKKDGKSTQKTLGELKTAVIQAPIDVLEIYRMLFVDHYIPIFRYKCVLRHTEHNDPLLVGLKKDFSNSQKLGGNQTDALRIYEQLKDNKWITSRIQRHLKAWTKLSDNDKKERKYEAILHAWAQQGIKPNVAKIEEYLDELEAKKISWKSLWKDGLITFKSAEETQEVVVRTKSKIKSKVVPTDLKKWKSQINDTCMEILTPIAIALLCKRQQWEKQELLQRILLEYNIPVMTQTKTQLGRLVDKLIIQRMHT